MVKNHVKPPILDVQITMFGCFTRQTLRIFPLKSLLKLTEGHEPRLGSRILWIRTIEMEDFGLPPIVGTPHIHLYIYIYIYIYYRCYIYILWIYLFINQIHPCTTISHICVCNIYIYTYEFHIMFIEIPHSVLICHSKRLQFTCYGDQEIWLHFTP